MTCPRSSNGPEIQIQVCPTPETLTHNPYSITDIQLLIFAEEMNGPMDKGMLEHLTRTRDSQVPRVPRYNNWIGILRGKTKGTFAFYKMKYWCSQRGTKKKRGTERNSGLICFGKKCKYMKMLVEYSHAHFVGNRWDFPGALLVLRWPEYSTWMLCLENGLIIFVSN